ncbi:MAG: PTS sugar transporter subunit IIC [Calditrichaeota bacterium]|nr:PTS sugar transporter subunit IIC [Calditrichota bacterium]
MVGWLALFGAIVYLDTTAAFQFMLCQPAIACPLYGLVVGRPEIGLFFGLTFQLLWLRSLPVGAAQFHEGNLGALVATAVAAAIPKASAGETTLVVLGFAAFAGIITAGLGRHLTTFVRQRLRHFADAYEIALRQEQWGQSRLVFLAALFFNAIAGAAFTLVLFFVSLQAVDWLLDVPAGRPLSAQTAQSTGWLWEGLFTVLLGAGVGIAAARFFQRKTLLWLISGLVIGVGILWL